MGIGPFFTMEVSWEKAVYRGEVGPLAIRVGLAQTGSTQIELIEQTAPGGSCYRDVVPEGQTGFHHVCEFTDDVDGDAAALSTAGIEIAGELPRADGSRTLYVDTREQIGSMLEILSASDYLLSVYALVADAARDWDGENPIRSITPELLAEFAAR